jgi:hypothetical protein
VTCVALRTALREASACCAQLLRRDKQRQEKYNKEDMT